MRGKHDLSRRQFLGCESIIKPAVHVSSAVVRVIEARREEVVRRILELPGAEVAQAEGSKLIVVMETDDSGTAGSHLAAISGFEGVLAAALVFEQGDYGEEPGGSS